MTDATWLRSPAMQPLVRELASSVVGRYLVDEGAAGRLVVEVLSRDQRLRRLVDQGMDAPQIRRTGAFKTASAAARRHVYYQLRRYSREGGGAAPATSFECWAQLAAAEREERLRQVAAGHVSTLERLDSLADLHDRLFARILAPRTVLDVGCGLYPLLFPLDAQGRTVERYVAMDRDARSIEILERYAAARGDGWLIAVRADIADGWAAVRRAGGVDRFDLALLLKAVPVLRRLRPQTLALVRDIPADVVVLTGAVQSMSRRERIDRRERRTLLRFVNEAGWRVSGEFRTADEVGLVAEPGGGDPPSRPPAPLPAVER